MQQSPCWGHQGRTAVHLQDTIRTKILEPGMQCMEPNSSHGTRHGHGDAAVPTLLGVLPREMSSAAWFPPSSTSAAAWKNSAIRTGGLIYRGCKIYDALISQSYWDKLLFILRLCSYHLLLCTHSTLAAPWPTWQPRTGEAEGRFARSPLQAEAWESFGFSPIFTLLYTSVLPNTGITCKTNSRTLAKAISTVAPGRDGHSRTGHTLQPSP